MRKKFLKRIKPLFFVFPLVGAISLSSCSSSTDNDKYYVGQGVMDSQYNHSSEITDTLKKMTVSLGFEYHKNNSDVIKKDIQKVSGTGWIYKIDGNDYYFATNLHVASSYSFKATVSNNDKQSSSLFNYMISTSIKFIPPNAQKNEMEPVLYELEPHSKSFELTPHEGEEFGYVLRGNIVIVNSSKNEEYHLKKGETFYLKGNDNHYIENQSDKIAKFLWICTPPIF